MKRLVVFIILILLVGFAVIVYQKPRVSRESVGGLEISVKGFANNNIELINPLSVNDFVDKISTDSAESNYFKGLRSVEWELVGESQSGFKVIGANGSVEQSVGYNYDEREKRLVLKAYYAPAILNEIYGLGERGAVRFNVDLMRYFCMANVGDVARVEYCGKFALEYVGSGAEKKLIFQIHRKVGLKLFNIVKPAYAQCSGGQLTCGSPAQEGCTCSQSGYTCGQNGADCGTFGTCSGCVPYCEPNGNYRDCSTWSYLASTCTAVKTNCESLGTCVVGGSYYCNWACTVNCAGRCGVWSCGQYCGDCPPGVTPLPTSPPSGGDCSGCVGTAPGWYIQKSFTDSGTCAGYGPSCSYSNGCCTCETTCCSPPCDDPPDPPEFQIRIYKNIGGTNVAQFDVRTLYNPDPTSDGNYVLCPAGVDGANCESSGNCLCWWTGQGGDARIRVKGPTGGGNILIEGLWSNWYVDLWTYNDVPTFGWGDRNQNMAARTGDGQYRAFLLECWDVYSSPTNLRPTGVVPLSSYNGFRWDYPYDGYYYGFGIGVGVTQYVVKGIIGEYYDPNGNDDYHLNPGVNYLWSVNAGKSIDYCKRSEPATANVCFQRPELEMCAIGCGQSKDCAGECSTIDCGDPSAPRNVYPAGDPTILNTDSLTFTWDPPLTPSDFDSYKLRVWDPVAYPTFTPCSTETGRFCSESEADIPNTATSYTFPRSGGLTSGRVYNWWMHAFDAQNCAGLGVCPDDDGWGDLAGGSFCYDGFDCSSQCGQTKDCPGQTCSNSFCGDFGAPIPVSPAGSLASPVVLNSSTASLSWTIPTLPGKTVDSYKLRVHDTTNNPTWTTGCTGIFCNENVSTTTYMYPSSGSLVSGNLYHWWVYPYDAQNCAGVVGSTCPGDDGIGDRADGYFCYEGYDCSQQCGQAKDCAGNCSNSYCGDFGAPIPVSPAGSLASPVVFNSSPVFLSWTEPKLTGKTVDSYMLRVHDTTANPTWTSGCTGIFCASGVTGTANYAYGDDTELVSGNVYHWWVYPYDEQNCAGVVGSTCPGDDGIGDRADGYFCYDNFDCSRQCGQARDCPGQNCGSDDCVTEFGAPTGISPAGTLASPTVIGTPQATLRWTAPVLAGRTVNKYILNVKNLTSGLAIGNTDISAGTTSFTYPSTGALAVGTVYQWWVAAYDATNCAGVVGSTCPNDGVGATAVGYFKYNSTPTYSSFVLQNKSSTVVPVEDVTNNRNHICQTVFDPAAGDGGRRARFVVTVSDADGATDIDSVRFRLGTSYEFVATNLTGAGSSTIDGSGATYYAPVTWEESGNNMRVTFPVQFATLTPSTTYDMDVTATDANGATFARTLVDRTFRIWDCEVDISGGVYDASSVSNLDCGDSRIYDPTNAYLAGYTLSFVDSAGVNNSNMSISGANYSGTVLWGKSYEPDFNDDIQIPALTDSNMIQGRFNNGPSCEAGLVVRNRVNAYVDNPAVTVDYAGVKDQESWYQVAGGAVQANGSLGWGVPMTCNIDDGCEPALSINRNIGDSNSGLVASGGVAENNSGCVGGCSYGPGGRNWYTNSETVETANYLELLREINTKNGVGTVVTGPINSTTLMTNVGGTGVVFVGGNLTINGNMVVDSPKYLVLIVNGNVTIDSAINQVDGILLVTGTVTAGGSSGTQLVINGSVFANGGVVFNRTYPGNPPAASLNNSQPAVLIKYRPEFIFQMPQKIFYGLSNWSGN